MLQPMHFVDQRPTPYATVADFFKTFTDEMHSLNVLSLLLTADKDKAEECFVCAMGECVEGIIVFMEWEKLLSVYEPTLQPLCRSCSDELNKSRSRCRACRP